MHRAGGTDWLELFGWLADRLGVPGAVGAVVLLVLGYLIVNGWLRAAAEKSKAPPPGDGAHTNGRAGDDGSSAQP